MNRFWRSPALRAGIVYGISGAGFAGANVLLARALPTVEYGILSLAIALLNFSIMLAPAGADGVVIRRLIAPSLGLLARVVITSTVLGACVVAIAYLIYDLPTRLLVFLLLGILAGGVTALAGAQFRSQQRFRVSLALTQSPNMILAFVAGLALAVEIEDALAILVVLTLGLFAAGTLGWGRLFAEKWPESGSGGPLPWAEALSYVGVSAAFGVLVQAERFVIPKALTVHDLATFGVLAATVGAPFRMLQLGVNYTLFPRLRASTTTSETRHLLQQEALVVWSAVMLASILVWYVAPAFVDWFLAGKYSLSPPLVAAAIIAGTIKVLDGFSQAIVTAFGNTRQLAQYNLLGWPAVVVGILASVIGARWGLVGVVAGAGLGWLARSLAGTYVVSPTFRKKMYGARPHE